MSSKSETLHCYGCGQEFVRQVVRGQKPLKCPGCRRPGRHPPKVIDLRQIERTPSHALALNVTTYRLALEMAGSAIRIGRYQDALDAIDEALKGRARVVRPRQA